MITCCIPYTIDPHESEAFEDYTTPVCPGRRLLTEGASSAASRSCTRRQASSRAARRKVSVPSQKKACGVSG